MTSRMAYNPLPFVLSVGGPKPKLVPPLPQIRTIVGQAGYDGIHADIRSGQPTVPESARLAAPLLWPRLEMGRTA